MEINRNLAVTQTKMTQVFTMEVYVMDCFVLVSVNVLSMDFLHSAECLELSLFSV